MNKFQKGLLAHQNMCRQLKELTDRMKFVQVTSVIHLIQLLENGETEFRIQLQGCHSSKELNSPNYGKRGQFLGCDVFHSISGSFEYVTAKRIRSEFHIDDGAFWCETANPISRKLAITEAK